MAKENKTEETKDTQEKHDFSPYWAAYPDAKVLYAVVIQGVYVVFLNKREAEKHQEAVKKLRGLPSELKEIKRN